MIKKLFLLLYCLPLAVGMSAQPELVVDKPMTLSDFTPWQNANVVFTKSSETDYETWITRNYFGALTLTSPGTWQVNSLTLPVNFFDYEPNYLNDDWEHPEKVFDIGTLVNQGATVSAKELTMRFTDTGQNEWLFFTVPFDVNYNDIKGGLGNWVIRRYDGQNRADVKAGQTWVTVKPGEELHANEGYIFMRDYNSIPGWSRRNAKRVGDDDDDDWDDDDPDYPDYGDEEFELVLPAANGGTFFASGDVTVPLTKYPAERANNAHWNYVGNPYACYYDLQAIKEKVDIYIYDIDSQTFRCFNTGVDNGFVLGPGQGFFVQADGIDHLTFAATGRRTSGNIGLPEEEENWDDDDNWGDDWNDEWADEARAKVRQFIRQAKQSRRTKRAPSDFNPKNPGDPNANSFNAQTGEAFFDLFEPGMLIMAASNLMPTSNDFRQVKKVTVVAPLGDAFMFTVFSNSESVDISRSSGFSLLPASAFIYMMNLRQVALPACVTEIAPEAFQMCMALEQMDCYAVQPPKVTQAVFSNMQTNLDDLVVRVPQEALAAYKADPVWGNLNIQSLDGGEVLQSVTMAVLTPEGKDIASQCNIVWRAEDGTLLGTGSELLGLSEGTKVTYSVSLPAALVVSYENVPEGSYTVGSTNNQISVNLTATGIIDLGSLDLRGSVGTLTFDYQPSSEASAALNANDVKLTITDKATGTALTDFVCQYPQVYFENTRLTAGQVVTLQATSRSSRFQPTTAEATADADGAFDLTMKLTEYGHARIGCVRAEGVTSVVVYVYNADGHFVGRYLADGGYATVSGLADGTYVAVVMQDSPLFNVMPTTADLYQSGLVKDSDYAYTSITVKAGTTSEYRVNVPRLDEEHVKYVDASSYFTSSASSMTLMQIATLKAKAVFKPEYRDRVSNLRLIFDFPEGTHYMDGSLITSKSDGSFQLSGRRLVVPCQADEQVKCCLEPDQSGSYTLTAMVQYTMDGQQYTQPLGSAAVYVEFTSLNLPNPTSTPTLHPHGYTYPNSHVTFYDGDYIIGETTASKTGFFEADVTLRPAYDDTYHQVHAVAQPEGGAAVALESQLILYDKDASMLTHTSMTYQDQRIIWNKLTGDYSPHYYNVDPSASGRAVFSAKLRNPQPDKILFPTFEVLTSDGKGYVFRGKWDEAEQVYTARHKFGGIDCLPVGVQFTFQYADPTPKDCEAMTTAEVSHLVSKHNELVSDVEQYMHYVDVVTDEDDKIAYTFTIGNDPTVYLMTEQMEDFDRIDALRQNDYVFMRLQAGSDSLGTYTFGDDRTLTSYYLDFTNREAWSAVITVPGRAAATRPALPRRVTALGFMADIGSIPGDIKKGIDEIKKTVQDVKDLEWSYQYLQEMKRMRSFYNSSLSTMYSACVFSMLASCPDGSLRVPDAMTTQFSMQLNSVKGQNDLFFRQMDALIESYEVALRNRVGVEYVTALASAGAGKGISAGVGKLLMKGKHVIHNMAKTGLGTFKECFKFIQDGASGTLGDWAGKGGNAALKELHLPTDFMNVKNFFEKWAPAEYTKRGEENMRLADAIKASYKECEEEEEGDDDDDDDDPEDIKETPRVPDPVTPAIDPSGFVYEGVEGNRVEGVTATVYFKADADSPETLWDAREFGQENPIVTPASGVYMWNVPKGLWQVRFEKAGYEPAQTAWLPVPPPQLEVNIPLTQHVTPEVTLAQADVHGVSILFSKYMQTASLSNISVRQDGAAVSGTLTFPGAEKGLTVSVRFVAASPFTAREVQLTVPAGAKSYAGDALSADDVRTLTVEQSGDDLMVRSHAADAVISRAYYDLSGQRVTSPLTPGVYLYVLRTAKGIETQKVIVK